MSNVIKIFEKPLPSTRSGAFFNAFSYPTKISPESIAVYIASITKPGDVVLDTFSGSGSTGIAAGSSGRNRSGGSCAHGNNAGGNTSPCD